MTYKTSQVFHQGLSDFDEVLLSIDCDQSDDFNLSVADLDNYKIEVEKQFKIFSKLIDAEIKHASMQANPAKHLAEILHNQQCTWWNHNNGCGWFYEFDNKVPRWTGRAHKQYLAKAEKLIAKAGSLEEALRWTEIEKELKSIY